MPADDHMDEEMSPGEHMMSPEPRMSPVMSEGLHLEPVRRR